MVKLYVDHYNDIHLNSAIGYIRPKDMLAWHQQEIQADRDRKLEAAREQQKSRRWRGRITNETHYFRLADKPSSEESILALWVITRFIHN